FHPSIRRIPTCSSVRTRPTLDHGKRGLCSCHEQVAEAHQSCEFAAGTTGQPLSASILTRGFTGARISNRLFHHHAATTLLYPCSTTRSDTAPRSFIRTNLRHVAYTAYQPLLQRQSKRESKLWRCYESCSATARLCFG